MACSNNLSSVQLSINMLVPMAHSLSTLDLTDNPVTRELRYADAAINVLPRCALPSLSSLSAH